MPRIFTLTGCAALLSVTAMTLAHSADRYGADQYRLKVQPGAQTASPPVQPAGSYRVEFVASPKLAARPFARLIEKAADDAALDPVLVHAVIAVESNYNPGARSPAGALGLMQVMPDTGERYGIRNLNQSKANVRAGTRYLKDLMAMFDRKLDLVLAAYNAGEGAVIKYGGRIPPYRETRNYVPAVLARYDDWREPRILRSVDDMVTAPSGRVRVQYMPGTLLDADAMQAGGFR